MSVNDHPQLHKKFNGKKLHHIGPGSFPHPLVSSVDVSLYLPIPLLELQSTCVICGYILNLPIPLLEVQSTCIAEHPRLQILLFAARGLRTTTGAHHKPIRIFFALPRPALASRNTAEKLCSHPKTHRQPYAITSRTEYSFSPSPQHPFTPLLVL